jgi:hypothetical protein
MATTQVFQATSTMPAYGIIYPHHYVNTRKWPVCVFCHGIGESGNRKSIQQCVDFHGFLKTLADINGVVFVLPQDADADVFGDGEIVKVWSKAKAISDGRLGLGGLSMGGGGTLSVHMSNATINDDVTFYFPICPPSWESMDERMVADDKVPMWSFMGAKDTAVSIASFTNTMGDIIAAGRKENFYVSIFPNKDHYIWGRVMETRPPITPAEGVRLYGGIECVDDPAVSVMEYFLMQWPNDYKPLPRLSDQAEPIPAPTPTPVPTADPVYFRNFIYTPPVYGITWSDGTKTTWRMPDMATIKEQYTNGDAKLDKQYLKVVYVNDGVTSTKVFGPIKK